MTNKTEVSTRHTGRLNDIIYKHLWVFITVCDYRWELWSHTASSTPDQMLSKRNSASLCFCFLICTMWLRLQWSLNALYTEHLKQHGAQSTQQISLLLAPLFILKDALCLYHCSDKLSVKPAATRKINDGPKLLSWCEWFLVDGFSLVHWIQSLYKDQSL